MMIKRITGVSFLLFSLSVSCALAQSAAHKASAFAVIDPVYSIVNKLPASNLIKDAATWIYGPAGTTLDWKGVPVPGPCTFVDTL